MLPKFNIINKTNTSIHDRPSHTKLHGNINFVSENIANSQHWEFCQVSQHYEYCLKNAVNSQHCEFCQVSQHYEYCLKKMLRTVNTANVGKKFNNIV